MPNLNNAILFIEDDNLLGKSFPYEFDRNLQSLVQTVGFENVKGAYHWSLPKWLFDRYSNY